MAAQPDMTPDNSGLREECGVFGIFGYPESAQLCYYALYALQHRGQESAGIAVAGEDGLVIAKGMGLVSEIFEPSGLVEMKGDRAIGHVRYSTSGSSNLENAQPLLVRTKRGQLALAHNGTLTNALTIRERLEQQGSIFQTSSDSEVIPHLIATSPAVDTDQAVYDSLQELQGAYALVLLTPDKLYAARDPMGIRPLVMGRTETGHVVASETCALDAVGAEYVRDVEPGELLVIDEDGLKSRRFAEAGEAFCIFEFVYFARPDSHFKNANVHLVRKEMGRLLARRFPVDADVVTGVPDSSISAASGYAEEAGIPYQVGLIKNRYIGRTFIQPSQEVRDRGVEIKLNPIKQVLDGQRVVLVDDSIVRGTTSRHLIQLLRDAGAREVHMRLSSSPYRYACYYGIDTPDTSELLAHNRTVEEVRETIGADSLAFLAVEDMVKAIGLAGMGFCDACFTGEYPVEPVDIKRLGRRQETVAGGRDLRVRK